MIKGALWLVQEIREGNTFTKEQLRAAFPGVSQADRRIRDLRDYGWTILASSEDASLLREDQRFVKVGVPVWDPVARRAAAPKTVSAKERQAAMARDDFMCTQCGIVGGEPYVDDSNQTAALSVTRLDTGLPDGRTETLLTTECKRCRAGSGSDRPAVSTHDLLSEIKDLDPSDQVRLARWMARGRRGATPLDRAWSAYRRMPATAREEIRNTLSD